MVTCFHCTGEEIYMLFSDSIFCNSMLCGSSIMDSESCCLFMTVLENVVFEEYSREVDYTDKSVTGDLS
jgi:hypothetical protein